MASRYRGVIKIKTMKDKTISASLIYRKIEGKLSTVEEERFEAWLKEGWEHREYYERMWRMYQQENVQEDECGSFRGDCDLLLLDRVLSGKHGTKIERGGTKDRSGTI